MLFFLTIILIFMRLWRNEAMGSAHCKPGKCQSPEKKRSLQSSGSWYHHDCSPRSPRWCQCVGLHSLHAFKLIWIPVHMNSFEWWLLMSSHSLKWSVMTRMPDVYHSGRWAQNQTSLTVNQWIRPCDSERSALYMLNVYQPFSNSHSARSKILKSVTSKRFMI